MTHWHVFRFCEHDCQEGSETECLRKTKAQSLTEGNKPARFNCCRHLDGSTEADETVVNTGTAGRSWGLFVESMILKEDRRDRSMLVQRIPSPKIENRNRNSSERIPRKKTLNLESGSEDKDEAQDESASVPRPDTPPPKTHRQTKLPSPKRKSINDRSSEMPDSSVKDDNRRH